MLTGAYIRSSPLAALVFALVACGGADANPLFGTEADDARSPRVAPDASDVPDGSSDAGLTAAPDATTPVDCAGDPGRDPRVVKGACGVFVAPERLGGRVDAPGTELAPIATVSAAIEQARKRAVPWIFVCAADYPEAIAMHATDAGVSFFGGLTCPGEAAAWQVVSDRRARIVQPSSGPTGPAWQIDGIGLPVRIVAIEVDAHDAATPSESSLAMLARDVTSLELSRVVLRAGAGAAGAPGAPGAEGLPVAPIDVPLDANSAAGGYGGSLTCSTGGGSAGGKGGSARYDLPDGRDGAPKVASAGGAGGTQAACLATHAPGAVGGPGARGSDGAGAGALGKLTESGWVAARGEAGTNGSPGQGGGGGGAGTLTTTLGGGTTGGGGAGGLGGCGGGAGDGGGAGGGSIALAVLRSHVVVRQSSLATAAGGVGGAGGKGHTGALDDGRYGYSGTRGSGDGCPGGAGGPGGHGGGGGGGAGGVSIAIIEDPTSRVEEGDDTTVSLGAAAPGGSAGGATNPGVNGIAQKILTAK